MTYNTPLPISGRDPDTVPLKERVAELEEAKRDPAKAIRAQRERRNREQLEHEREDFKEAWLVSGATEQEFERAWPELRKEEIKRRAQRWAGRLPSSSPAPAAPPPASNEVDRSRTSRN